MCTVMIRFEPGSAWPVLLAAVRDEFLDRPWEAPASHWPQHPSLVGGRDQSAGGTWLATRSPDDPAGPAVAAVLNGVRQPPSALPRPSRGGLPLAALTGSMPDSFDGYDGFHLVLATPSTVVVWSFDGSTLEQRKLEPGDHIIVNEGVDATVDPLVPHFAPLLAAAPTPPLAGLTTEVAWGSWVGLLRGDGLALDDPRALIIRKEFDGTEPGTAGFAGRVYGSGSATLVAVRDDRLRYDFTAAPMTPHWTPILQ